MMYWGRTSRIEPDRPGQKCLRTFNDISGSLRPETQTAVDDQSTRHFVVSYANVV